MGGNHSSCPKPQSGTSIEVLIPDFRGSAKDLDRVLDADPDILNHTWRRSGACNDRSENPPPTNEPWEFSGTRKREGLLPSPGSCSELVRKEMKLLKPSSISERPMLQSSRSVNTYDPPPITPRSIAGSRRKNFKNGTTSVSRPVSESSSQDRS